MKETLLNIHINKKTSLHKIYIIPENASETKTFLEKPLITTNPCTKLSTSTTTTTVKEKAKFLASSGMRINNKTVPDLNTPLLLKHTSCLVSDNFGNFLITDKINYNHNKYYT